MLNQCFPFNVLRHFAIRCFFISSHFFDSNSCNCETLRVNIERSKLQRTLKGPVELLIENKARVENNLRRSGCEEQKVGTQ